MRYTLLYIITLFLLFSCSNKTEQEERYAEIVSQWQGREIKLPAVMTDFLTGDTINLDDADFTILTYVDSAGCTGCKMKLPLWNEFIKVLDSISQYDFRSVMVVHSTNETDIRYTLNQYDYNHDVYVDTYNNIGKNNTFPEELVFQSFLIDRSHRVVAIGNPVYASGIQELYVSILSGKESVSPDGKSMVLITDNLIDLGTIKPGVSVSQNLTISNMGEDTVYIQKVIESCECMKVELSKKTIAPKSEIPVTITFSGDSIAGEFNRTAHIYYDNYDYPSIITIIGKIE